METMSAQLNIFKAPVHNSQSYIEYIYFFSCFSCIGDLKLTSKIKERS